MLLTGSPGLPYLVLVMMSALTMTTVIFITHHLITEGQDSGGRLLYRAEKAQPISDIITSTVGKVSGREESRVATSDCHLLRSKPMEPVPQRSRCEKSHCAEFLSRKDKTRRRNCRYMALEKFRNDKLVMRENDCDFMNGANRKPVALVSPPGAGNTWVRGLLERATGFCTGYNNCDHAMLTRGFIGENINSGSVLVVKTHMTKPQWSGGRVIKPTYAMFGSAIVLLRNPHDSMIAEWNRVLTQRGEEEVLLSKRGSNRTVVRGFFSHTGVAAKDAWCEWHNLHLL